MCILVSSQCLNKCQSNLAKCDIALLWYSPGGSTRREAGFGGCIWDPILGKERSYRGHRNEWYHRKSDVVSYRLFIVTITLTIPPQFAIECLRRSNQQGVVCRLNSLWSKIWGRNGLTDVSQILTQSGRDMGMLYTKEIVSISSVVWAQCTNMTDRQTDRWPRNGNIDRNRRNCFWAMSPKSALEEHSGSPSVRVPGCQKLQMTA